MRGRLGSEHWMKKESDAGWIQYSMHARSRLPGKCCVHRVSAENKSHVYNIVDWHKEVVCHWLGSRIDQRILLQAPIETQ